MQHYSYRPDDFVYQVEFNAIATGKIIAMSKRRIRWRYGFPNQEAIDAGQSGTKCRGEEHDVMLIWSVTSGKRMIMSNGKQILVGSSKSNIFEHKWTDARGNEIKLVAHATSPMSTASISRQYDLFVNGKSFFTLPKPYEIGLRGLSDTRIPGLITQSNGPNNTQRRSVAKYSDSGRNIVHEPDEDVQDLQKAIQASLRESREHLNAKGLELEEIAPPVPTSAHSPQLKQESVPLPPQVEEPLIDLLSDPVPVANQNALVLSDAAPQQYNIDPFALGSTGTQQIPVVDEFAPKPPTYSDVSNQILLNYHATAAGSVQAQQNVVQNTGNPFDNVQQQNPFQAPTSPTNYTHQQHTGNYNGMPQQNMYQQQQHGFR